MPIRDDVLEEAQRLITVGETRGLVLRLLGGLAVRLHSPSAKHRALSRKYPDIDFVIPAGKGADVETYLVQEGYTPNKTFNTLSGSHRQLFYDLERSRQVDVFIGSFEMCHKLPVAARLTLEPLTLPLAELFLTKAQIATINRKDMLDLLALVLDHAVGPGDQETINSDVIADLCAKDWGLYTTISINMQQVSDLVAQGGVDLDEAQSRVVTERLAILRVAMDSAPKGLAWKMRAKVGTRVRWYEEVEEVQR